MSTTFQKVADDWTKLTDAEKIALFNSTGEDTPTIAELATISPFKIVTYSKDDTAITTTVVAVPKDQIVMPKSLINTAMFEDINSMSISQTITKSQTNSSADIRYAFTTDLLTYTVYNSTTSSWDTIASTAIPTSGMTASQVEALTITAWHSLVFESPHSGIGIAFSLAQSYTADKAVIDNISFNVNMKGSWNHAVYGTDYTYGYPTNSTLNVTLLTDGSYKINYNEMIKQ